MKMRENGGDGGGGGGGDGGEMDLESQVDGEGITFTCKCC